MQWLLIVLACVAMSVTYGVLHDQVTARICVEYFTIGHPPVFATEDPTLLGLGWGVIATWWVGAMLGVPLSCAARVGGWPKRSAASLVRPLLILAGCSGALAVIAGLVGYAAAANGWVVLIGPLAERVPTDKHVAFITDLWAHSASYLSGFVGGVAVIVRTLLARHRASLSPTE